MALLGSSVRFHSFRVAFFWAISSVSDLLLFIIIEVEERKIQQSKSFALPFCIHFRASFLWFDKKKKNQSSVWLLLLVIALDNDFMSEAWSTLIATVSICFLYEIQKCRNKHKFQHYISIVKFSSCITIMLCGMHPQMISKCISPSLLTGKKVRRIPSNLK